MKAVIMAGGKGTRMQSVSTEIPKAMLEVGGLPTIYHQIECLKKNNIRDIIVVIGHLGEKIKEYLNDGSKFGVNITYFEESLDNPLGTAGSLYYLKDSLKEDFIYLYGDIVLDVNFKRMVKFHYDNHSDATLLTHPNSHPFDSDLVKTNQENKILMFDYKTNIRNYYYKNLVNAGIFIFSPKIFEYIKEPKKIGIEKDVIAKIIEDKLNVYSYKTSEYVKDMGTPLRFEQVNRDYQNNLLSKRNLGNKQKCIFLDRDGTINKYVGLLKNESQFELIEMTSEAIKMINSSEYLCIVVTNQPVLARGECSFEEIERIHQKMETLLGNDHAYIDQIYYCPHHPDKGYDGEVKALKIDCNCRKPKTGMIDAAVKDYNIDPSLSFIIGDTSNDIMLGKNSGMKTIQVLSGHHENTPKYDVKPDYVLKDLYESTQKILRK